MPPRWPWPDEDISLLKELYPYAPKEVILSRITHKTWHSIQKMASRLGIKRDAGFDIKSQYIKTKKSAETKMDREQLLQTKEYIGSKPWSEEEHETLRIFYPKSDKEIVLDTLRKRSWMEIEIEAELLGIKRRVNDSGWVRKRNIRYTLSKKRLAKLLADEDITIEDIAERLNTTPDIVRRNISRYGL
jgi:hypothetical protein